MVVRNIDYFANIDKMLYMNEILKALTNAGLNQKEAEIYLILLKLKTATAYKIAKDSSIKKPTVYVILETLRQKGFILKTPSKRGTVYTAKSPDEFINIIEQKFTSVLNTLPLLKSIFKESSNNINVFYFEGMKGLEDLCYYRFDEINDTEMVGFFAKPSTNFKEYEALFTKWSKDLLKRKVKISGITPDHQYMKGQVENNRDAYRNLKLVDPEKYSSTVSIDVSLNFVRIMDLKNLNGVIIENTDLANAIHQVFDMVWEGLK